MSRCTRSGPWTCRRTLRANARSTPNRAPRSAAALRDATSPDLEVRGEPALELVCRPRLATLVARRGLPEPVDDQSVHRARVHEVAGPVAVLEGARLHLHRAEFPERVLERDRAIVEVPLLESPAGAGPGLLHTQRDRMHRGEDVEAVRREDAGDLGDDTRRVRHEDHRVVVIDDVELPMVERGEVAHVALDEAELRPAAAGERAHRGELALGDVEQRRGRAELREQDRVPSAAARERQHTLAFESDATKPATRELVEEAPLAPDVARRLAQRARVRDAGLREALPHLPVVLADVVDRGVRGTRTPGRRGQRTLPDCGDAPRHGTLSQHWFRCASRKCRTRASSYAVSSSIQFQAVSTIAPGAILS